MDIKITIAEKQVILKSNSETSDGYDSKGVHHFYENEENMSLQRQHMGIETSKCVSKHGKA